MLRTYGTYKDEVTLKLYCLGRPTYYRVSEDSTFENDEWVKFTTNDYSINVALQTAKLYELFIQVKTFAIESYVVSVRISKFSNQIPVKLKSVIIENGALTTNKTSLFVRLQYDGTPTHFKFLLNPVLVSGEVDWGVAEWTPFSSLESIYVIDDVSQANSCYFLLKDANESLSEKVSTIIYNQL